ncbi:UNVERIFIED_CONTAM: hypothetical protein FKN15_064764 [Acipenser sinensis]
MTDAFRQPSLFYHLGVRESFSMANNIILYCDTNSDSLQSLQSCTGNYNFIPYMVTPHNKVYCCESSLMKGLTELMQPSFEMLLGPICMPLVDRFTQLLKVSQATCCQYFRESILNDIRKARELYTGVELAAELSRIRQRLDNVECLSADIVINLLLSYRDIQVGMFKIHPEIPESMSLEAKAFILRCFEPDPDKRATAGDLLTDEFLTVTSRKRRTQNKFTGALTKTGWKHCIPVENFEDHSAPPSPEEKDTGFFMLKKDSERRATLHKILTEDQDKVVKNLVEALAQGSEEIILKQEHISTLVVSLREFVRTTDRKIIANTLSRLKLELDFDSHAISQLQVVLFGFQDAVNKVLRNHNIKPHWMFALDNIIRKAVQTAITILVPELRPHFSLASESDAADQDDAEDDLDPHDDTRNQSGQRQSAANDDTVPTSGVSTLSSTVSHDDSHTAQRSRRNAVQVVERYHGI